MKLRIRENSLRIRITHGELLKLADGQGVQQTTDFSVSSKLVTSVEPSAQVEQCIATFDRGGMALQIPLDQIRRLAQTGQISIEAHQTIDEGRFLHILLEKDFDCLHPRPDENVDTFPNPKRLG